MIAPQSRWGEFVWWWVASLCGLLSANLFWIADRIAVWPVRDSSVLEAGHIYSPPLAWLPFVADSTHWHYWQFAIVAALLYGWIACRLSTRMHPAVVFAYIWTLSHFNTRGALLGGAVLWLAIEIGNAMEKGGELPRQSEGKGEPVVTGLHRFMLPACVAVSVLAAAVTIEYGLVLAVLGLALLTWRIDKPGPSPLRGQRTFGALAWVATIAVVMLLVPGMGATLLRPWSWMWVSPPPSLFPSLAALWDLETRQITAWHGILLLFIMGQWMRLFRDNPPRLWDAGVLSMATLLVVGCCYYSWLGAILAAGAHGRRYGANGNREAGRTLLPRLNQGSLWAGIGLGGLLYQVVTNSTTVLSADLIQRRVTPVLSATPGPVMLLNLDHTPRWQVPELLAHFPLLVNDRWEAYAPWYDQLAAVSQDWKEWKREAYLRHDGSWGGYGAVFERWQPSLIALDAQDEQAIRQVTLDSNWKIVGVDAEEVLFGTASDPRAVAQALRCMSLFSFLEIPRSAAELDFEGSLALGAPQDTVRVANVLTAMRMPLAALRLLPDTSSREVQVARTLAYFELAHRTLRYSGHVSILDSIRAGRLTQELMQEPLLPSTKDRLDRAQMALAQAAGQVLELQSAAETSRGEQDTVRLIINGDLTGAQQAIDQQEPTPSWRFFRVLMGANPNDAANLSRKIAAELTADGDMPAALVAEFLFYCGQLAIESGDLAESRNFFRECLARDPFTPFRDLADFYLSQM
ncbi:MAG: hypothetical protein KatS3mg111_1970 [Pirellulaceae bacterium]|nr:MAG: hypothetical protein KatS3mg111_1970 [Pirellulaceae bacterium]